MNVSPVTATSDMSFGTARSSLSTDLNGPRRVNSDSMVTHLAGSTARFVDNSGFPAVADFYPAARPNPAAAAPVAPAAGLTTQDAQMMQVLTSAAQRVAQEAMAHVIAPPDPLSSNEQKGHELQALAKQQHVLTVTAQALDQEVSAQGSDVVPPSSHALVAVAQQVVFQAARQVAADRSAVAAMSVTAPPPSQVTVNEVSVATQSAVAQAVEITGPLGTEVDVMMTASSLLQQQTRPTLMSQVEPMDPMAFEAVRPHSTGTLSQPNYPGQVPANFAPSSSMGIIDF